MTGASYLPFQQDFHLSSEWRCIFRSAITGMYYFRRCGWRFCDMALTIPDLIRKKRDGIELSAEEISFFVNAVVRGNIDDSQIGAMLMAMFLNKQTLRETIHLTRAMIHTGEVLRFEGYSKSCLVDKHSTGGVGDKVSIVLVPALAACGVKVPMLSGRSLGYTGGTLDKLESIPNFQTRLDLNQMKECLDKAGCFICGVTNSVAPADNILYKFRDVTGTVEAPNLIAASILSKKASEGIGTLVMDVKFGRGSAFENEAEAEKMAELLRAVAEDLELNMRVVITEMETPLGRFVGNALEVVESVMCLRDECRNSVTDLVKLLGGVILESKGLAGTVEEGEEMIGRTLQNSKALNCFFAMLTSQGVSEQHAADICSGEYWKVLGKARHITRFATGKRGVVVGIDALGIARACWQLGAGRVKSSDGIDHSVGVVLLKEIGDDVEEDQWWIEVHHSSEKLQPEVENFIRGSLTVEENGVNKRNAKLKARIV